MIEQTEITSFPDTQCSADLKKIFDPLLERVSVLMKTQLDGAKEKGLTVKVCYSLSMVGIKVRREI